MPRDPDPLVPELLHRIDAKRAIADLRARCQSGL